MWEEEEEEKSQAQFLNARQSCQGCDLAKQQNGTKVPTLPLQTLKNIGAMRTFLMEKKSWAQNATKKVAIHSHHGSPDPTKGKKEQLLNLIISRFFLPALHAGSVATTGYSNPLTSPGMSVEDIKEKKRKKEAPSFLCSRWQKMEIEDNPHFTHEGSFFSSLRQGCQASLICELRKKL